MKNISRKPKSITRHPAIPFLRRIISPYNHGIRDKSGRPVPRKTRETLIRHYNSVGAPTGSPSNKVLVSHLEGEETVYGSRSEFGASRHGARLSIWSAPGR